MDHAYSEHTRPDCSCPDSMLNAILAYIIFAYWSLRDHNTLSLANNEFISYFIKKLYGLGI